MGFPAQESACNNVIYINIIGRGKNPITMRFFSHFVLKIRRFVLKIRRFAVKIRRFAVKKCSQILKIRRFAVKDFHFFNITTKK